jgi:DNA mismatch endonuclease (patch repair protein)
MGKSPPTDDIKRRRTMRRIKSKNTSIEVSLRKALWHSGIRYRKNYAKLPGTPDIAILKYQIAIFCDGEFWHGKDWELKKPKLKSNRDYWINKIERNMGRDRQNEWVLHSMGWKVIRFWGLEIKKDLKGCIKEIKYAIIQRKIENSDICFDYNGHHNENG